VLATGELTIGSRERERPTRTARAPRGQASLRYDLAFRVRSLNGFRVRAGSRSGQQRQRLSRLRDASAARLPRPCTYPRARDAKSPPENP
jgi:hypothetical protein